MQASVWRHVCFGAIAMIALTRLLQAQDAAVVESPITTFRVSTQLVLLDVAILDKKGHPSGVKLDRDDFTITEDGKPQRLLSFEPPSLEPTASTNIVVLDELNTRAADKAYYLVCFEQYLRSLPETLPNPTEFMVLTDSTLKIVQSPTRSRTELLSALAHLPARDVTLANLEQERLRRTLGALELVAMENLGASGKSAVLWLGPGYGIDLDSQSIDRRSQTELYIRYLTNTYLESRTALHVVFPPDFVLNEGVHLGSSGSAALSAADPYRSGINLRTLAAQTGGSVYTSTNDLVTAMRQSFDLGSRSYKLGYRPDNVMIDRSFRQVRVVLRDPNLRVVTKSGYYAPDPQEISGSQAMQVFQMTEAAKTTLPFKGIPVRVTHIRRSLDAKEAEFTLFAEGINLPWRPGEKDESLSEFTVGGLSLSKEGKRLSSNFKNIAMMARSQDPTVLERTTASFKLTLPIPSNADRVRLVVSSRKNGQLGCVDVDLAVINASPLAALPQSSF